jgi:hypothetical protein
VQIRKVVLPEQKPRRPMQWTRTAHLRRRRFSFADLKNKSTEELGETVQREVEMLKELEHKEPCGELQEPQVTEP